MSSSSGIFLLTSSSVSLFLILSISIPLPSSITSIVKWLFLIEKFTSIFPNASITAFECSPKLIDKCRYNSNKSDRITLVEKMVTDTPDNTIFYNCKGGESSMCYPKYDKHYPINVSTIRMDEYLDNSEVDFLWIDVQGAELNVLHSFGNKLKNVNTIYCEVDICKYRYDSDSTLDTVSEFLFNNGYQIKDMMILNPNEAHVIFE